jgi:hypothetical protein
MQNYEIDEIINLMKQYIPKKDIDGELDEQDAAPAAASGGGGGEAAEYPTVTKWESGVTRGPANQIGLTKWRDIVKVTRGKANTLL